MRWSEADYSLDLWLLDQVAQIQKEIDAQRADYSEEWENKSDFCLFHLLLFPAYECAMVNLWPGSVSMTDVRQLILRVVIVYGSTTPCSIVHKRMEIRTRGDQVIYFWCSPTNGFVLGVNYGQFELHWLCPVLMLTLSIQHWWLAIMNSLESRSKLKSLETLHHSIPMWISVYSQSLGIGLATARNSPDSTMMPCAKIRTTRLLYEGLSTDINTIDRI